MLLMLAFAGVLGGGGVYRRAEAQLSESLNDLGVQMMHYDGATDQRAPHDLVINGQTLLMSSGSTNHSAAQVLDHFEARCADMDGGIAEQLAQLRADHPEAPPPERPSMLRTPTIRNDNHTSHGHSGYVACIDLGAESVSVAELSARLRRYGTSHDIGDIGEIRYVFVEESEPEAGRDTPRSHFVALWSDGSFDLDRMFPTEGDVPGRDPAGMTRPPASRRVLQGFERGQPHTMTVYETTEDEADLERFFVQQLPADGWSLTAAPRDTRDPTGGAAPTTFVAERGDRMAIVVLNTSLRTGRASAAIFETR